MSEGEKPTLHIGPDDVDLITRAVVEFGSWEQKVAVVMLEGLRQKVALGPQFTMTREETMAWLAQCQDRLVEFGDNSDRQP